MSAKKKSPVSPPASGMSRITHVRTICQPASTIFALCADAENLRRVLPDGTALTELAEDRWGLSGDADGKGKLVVQLTEISPDESIAWESGEGDFPHLGRLELTPAPGDEGTEVKVTIDYEPKGSLGAKLFERVRNSPASPIADALRRLKALLEAGEIPTIEGQPVGEPQKSKGKK